MYLGYCGDLKRVVATSTAANPKAGQRGRGEQANVITPDAKVRVKKHSWEEGALAERRGSKPWKQLKKIEA